MPLVAYLISPPINQLKHESRARNHFSVQFVKLGKPIKDETIFNFNLKIKNQEKISVENKKYFSSKPAESRAQFLTLHVSGSYDGNLGPRGVSKAQNLSFFCFS